MGREGPHFTWGLFLWLLNTVMKEFTIQTLVDITETKQVKKEQGREEAYHEQQNFLMLMQSVSMRANPLNIKGPTKQTIDVSEYGFGSTMKGEHSVWTVKFSIEYEGAYTDNEGNEVGYLIDDLNFVPVTVNLTETAIINPKAFNTKSDTDRNTVISVVSDK